MIKRRDNKIYPKAFQNKLLIDMSRNMTEQVTRFKYQQS